MIHLELESSRSKTQNALHQRSIPFDWLVVNADEIMQRHTYMAKHFSSDSQKSVCKPIRSRFSSTSDQKREPVNCFRPFSYNCSLEINKKSKWGQKNRCIFWIVLSTCLTNSKSFFIITIALYNCNMHYAMGFHVSHSYPCFKRAHMQIHAHAHTITHTHQVSISNFTNGVNVVVSVYAMNLQVHKLHIAPLCTICSAARRCVFHFRRYETHLFQFFFCLTRIRNKMRFYILKKKNMILLVVKCIESIMAATFRWKKIKVRPDRRYADDSNAWWNHVSIVNTNDIPGEINWHFQMPFWMQKRFSHIFLAHREFCRLAFFHWTHRLHFFYFLDLHRIVQWHNNTEYWYSIHSHITHIQIMNETHLYSRIVGVAHNLSLSRNRSMNRLICTFFVYYFYYLFDTTQFTIAATDASISMNMKQMVAVYKQRTCLKNI